jgi:hypothetical protein
MSKIIAIKPPLGSFPKIGSHFDDISIESNNSAVIMMIANACWCQYPSVAQGREVMTSLLAIPDPPASSLPP